MPAVLVKLLFVLLESISADTHPFIRDAPNDDDPNEIVKLNPLSCISHFGEVLLVIMTTGYFLHLGHILVIAPTSSVEEKQSKIERTKRFPH